MSHVYASSQCHGSKASILDGFGEIASHATSKHDAGDVADGFRQNLCSMVVPAEASIARARNGAAVIRLPS
jgi:hypothetical protein